MHRPTLITTLIALLACGCAALQPARMQLPEGVQTRTEAVPLQGLRGAGSGSFQLGTDSGSFTRSASRLAGFNDSFGRNSSSARYQWRRADGSVLEGQCSAAQTGAQLGALSLGLQPWQVACEWRDGGRLALQARPGPAGTHSAREGRFEAGGVVLDLRSEHRLQGAAWPLAQPVGYLLLHQGVVVGTVDLSDSTPVLRRPAAGAPLHGAVTQAALALALLWDPAAQ